MIRHFFLDKTNTIIEGTTKNVGLNPILSVGYGKFLMRGLVHFDLNEIKQLIDDKTFCNLDKLQFTLKMTNCFSVDNVPYEKKIPFTYSESLNRASSVSIMVFKLPCHFDMGRGYDYSDDFFIMNKNSSFEDTSNWYFAKKMIPWPYEMDNFNLEDSTLNISKSRYYDRNRAEYFSKEILKVAERIGSPDYEWEDAKEDLYEIANNRNFNSYSLHGGIYSNEELYDEYEKFINGEDSIVIGVQHFDFGNENLSIDITKYVLDCLSDECVNYGLGISFVPYIERIGSDEKEFVINFFTDHTNTFFHPYIESSYNEYIEDDRESFTIGKTNKLYLYVNDDGNPVNLDQNPTCEINGNVYNSEQATKGVYFVEIEALSEEFEPAAIYYDKWSEIVLNGREIEDVELEFSTRPMEHKISINDMSFNKNILVPFLSGINDNENLNKGEIRNVVVEFREKFTTKKRHLTPKAEYRIYVKDGVRELDVINYTKVEKAFLENFFNIHTDDLIPNTYYVDIRVNSGKELIYFKNVLKFNIISNVTERYE